jgi:hypothetical protein
MDLWMNRMNAWCEFPTAAACFVDAITRHQAVPRAPTPYCILFTISPIQAPGIHTHDTYETSLPKILRSALRDARTWSSVGLTTPQSLWDATRSIHCRIARRATTSAQFMLLSTATTPNETGVEKSFMEIFRFVIYRHDWSISDTWNLGLHRTQTIMVSLTCDTSHSAYSEVRSIFDHEMVPHLVCCGNVDCFNKDRCCCEL